MTICSLNEIEVYSRRAYRGAGIASSAFSWGLAEEAGRSVRYLASSTLANNTLANNTLANSTLANSTLANSLQPLTLQPLTLQPSILRPSILRPLLNLLANIEGIDYASLRPRCTSDAVWHAIGSDAKNAPQEFPKESPKESLCPIISGCALSDLASSLPAETITLQNLFSPLLLLPFLARASQNHALVFEVSWQRAIITARAGNLVNIDASFEELLAPMAEQVTVAHKKNTRASKEASQQILSQQKINEHQGGGGVLVRDEDWQELQAYAARIYVPASEESRRQGAGAVKDEN